jgi:(p)ppGpp synthase/HD superfamily hydrolase
MLIVLEEDVRVVLIKLATHSWMRTLKRTGKGTSSIARETLAIFTPSRTALG